jgi:hypothetical protein
LDLLCLQLAYLKLHVLFFELELALIVQNLLLELLVLTVVFERPEKQLLL